MITILLCLLFTAMVRPEPLMIILKAGPNNVTLQFSGEVEKDLTESDIQAFQITDENLKIGVESIMAAKPYEVSLGNWTDVYRKRNWSPVKKTLTPIKAALLKFTNEPVIIYRTPFNNTTTQKGTFRSHISKEVRNTVSTSWSESKGLSVDTQIGFDIQLFSASNRLSFSTSWGTNKVEERSTSFGSGSEVSIELEPGDEVEAILSATLGVAEFEVDYVVGLKGDVGCKFSGSYRGRNYWRQDINTVMWGIGVPLLISSRQVVKIDAYSEAKVTLLNVTSNAVLQLRTAFPEV